MRCQAKNNGNNCKSQHRPTWSKCNSAEANEGATHVEHLRRLLTNAVAVSQNLVQILTQVRVTFVLEEPHIAELDQTLAATNFLSKTKKAKTFPRVILYSSSYTIR